jgi:hypothetical protein
MNSGRGRQRVARQSSMYVRTAWHILSVGNSALRRRYKREGGRDGMGDMQVLAIPR